MKAFPALCGALTALALMGCSPQEHTSTLLAMDTVMELSIYGEKGEQVLPKAEALIGQLETLLSTTDTGSEVYALNQGRTVPLSADTQQLLRRALELCAQTEGALDLTIYPVVKAWGFTTEHYQVPDPDTLSTLMSGVDYRQVALEGDSLTLPAGIQIDLGAVAKGYTGDRLIELFRQEGLSCAYVNLGGNVQTLGASPDGDPWRIGIQNPAGSGYVAVVGVTDQAVVTSGAYERYFEQDGVRYGHILDPETGYPADSGLASVTIISSDGTLADGLSTALFVMGKERAVEFWRNREDFEFVLIDQDGTFTISQGIEDSFSFYGDEGSFALEVVRR